MSSIILPTSKLFNLDPLNLQVANDETAKALKSGKAEKQYMDLLATCFNGQPRSVIKAAQSRFSKINIPAFSAYWCTGGLESYIGVSAVVTAIYISDDARDGNDQDKKFIGQMIDQFLQIPIIVDRLWKAAKEGLRRNTTKLGLKAADEYGLKGDALADACCRLLAIGSAICRQHAGSDDVYEWYVEESRVWMSYTYTIREKDIKEVSLSEVLEHRYIESACHLTVATISACDGISLSKHVIRSENMQKIIKYASMHVAVLNDIFSYDREVQCPGGESNLVEYNRIVASPNQTVKEALKLTIDLLNDYMKKYIDVYNQIDLSNKEVSQLVPLTARMLVGNITWSLQAERYERKEYVAECIDYDESKLYT